MADADKVRHSDVTHPRCSTSVTVLTDQKATDRVRAKHVKVRRAEQFSCR